MCGRDRGGAVDERVDEREPDRVRLGARVERAGDPGVGFGQPRVGVPPQLARVGVEAQLARAPGGGQVASEPLGERRAFKRVPPPAFGQQPDATAGDQEEAVEEAVGELDGGGVVAQLGGGDVADDADVRGGRGRGRCA